MSWVQGEELAEGRCQVEVAAPCLRIQAASEREGPGLDPGHPSYWVIHGRAVQY